eukprot:CAMPEP_0172384850 /NCGR_PEP_ID=MMETSP1061-20121228/2568_1 /TAXON_ID=37318 /ORGANISM="Pseudo-nitzschia pungens, Strain cf. pungens" /LENGTH=177 /DNA_ID=CAMNT_0013113631 /DNA_START=149 /DNA_END=682 /DNA_ORIENTATION=+
MSTQTVARLLRKSSSALSLLTSKHHQQSFLSGRVVSSTPSRCFSDEGPKRRISKVKKKERKSSADTGRSRDLELLLAFLDAPKIKPPPADEEETARRELVKKNYTAGKFKQHNEENHDIACKLKLKKHAIGMLPKRTALKDKALEVDSEYPPRWRTIPAWTPPIPGFNPSDYMGTEE